MKKSVFTKSMKILIVSLLLLAVFFRKERSQKLMALAFILWAAVTVGILLLRHSGKLFKKIRILYSALKQKIGQMMEASEETPASAPVREYPEEHVSPTKPAFPASDSREYETMLVRFGRIHVEPMVIGSFADAENGKSAKPEPGGADEETTPEPSVVDVRVWYDLIGQKALEELITDLNANGHSMLTIKENGDIVVSCQKKKILKATLDSFPGKTYWKELISILEENELKGKISDNSLQVSWI